VHQQRIKSIYAPINFAKWLYVLNSDRMSIRQPNTDDPTDARSVIRVERERHIGEKHTCETVYYISSHAPNGAILAEAIRFHWEVENKAHWVLDVVYREDGCRIRRGNGAFNVGLLRRLCMNLARLHPARDSVRGKLKDAAWDDTFREQLLFGINE
jgi:predicted transposase YbfD/YdcC